MIALVHEGEKIPVVEKVVASQNTRWLPRQVSQTSYSILLPKDLISGRYDLQIAMFYGDETRKFIELAISNKLKVNQNYYKIHTVTVEN